MKTKKPTFIIIKSDPYPYDVLFTIGSTEEQIIKYIENRCHYKLDAEEKKYIDIKGKQGRVVRFKNNALFLWVKSDYIPTLGHEIFHVVELLMDKINTPLNESTGEVYAYLIEYYWKQVLPHLKK